MALPPAPSSDLRSILEPFLKCPVCRSIYNSAVNIPHFLDCKHTVCKPCIQQLIDYRNQSKHPNDFACPVCRAKHMIKADDPINRDVFPVVSCREVAEIAEVFNRTEVEKGMKCSSCDGVSVRIFTCIKSDCEEKFLPLCIDCLHGYHNGHGFDPFTKETERLRRDYTLSSSIELARMDCRWKSSIDEFETHLKRVRDNRDVVVDLLQSTAEKLHELEPSCAILEQMKKAAGQMGTVSIAENKKEHAKFEEMLRSSLDSEAAAFTDTIKDLNRMTEGFRAPVLPAAPRPRERPMPHPYPLLAAIRRANGY